MTCRGRRGSIMVTKVSDERVLPWRRAVGRLVEFSRTFCEFLIVAMMLLITIEVVARSFFRFSLQMVDEVSVYLLVAVTFLAVNVSLHEKALFRVAFLHDRLAARLQSILQLLFNVLSLGFAIIMEYQLIRLVISSYSRNNVAPTLLATPIYLPQLIMPIGMALMLVILVAEIAHNLTDIFRTRIEGTDSE